ncbi:MAG: hypothetical protein AABZ94_08825 [Candidatus Eisenbacteria bacterium]
MRRQVSFWVTVADLWTRFLLVAVPAACAFAAAVASAAPADGERWAAVGLIAGYRTFASPLELEGEFAIGARVSLGLSDRVTIMIDGAHADPTRRTSGKVSSFGDIRALVSYRLRERGVRPYILAGLGGQILNFHDAPASASAIVAAGLGAEITLSPEWLAIFEGAADFYRGRFVTYSSTGQELSSTNREMYATGIFSAGLLYRF